MKYSSDRKNLESAIAKAGVYGVSGWKIMFFLRFVFQSYVTLNCHAVN